MKTYAFLLRSDTGDFWCRVYAHNWDRAIELVLDWQKCPRRAIISKHIVK